MGRKEDAVALLAAGRVVPYSVWTEGVGIKCHVTGENAEYDVAVWKDREGRIRRLCRCEWCEFHPVACDCKHALAVQTLIGVPL